MEHDPLKEKKIESYAKWILEQSSNPVDEIEFLAREGWDNEKVRDAIETNFKYLENE